MFHDDEQVLYEVSNLYRVRVSDGERDRYSNIVELMPPSFEQEIDLFPNPVSNGDFFLRIRSDRETQAQAELMNMFGQVIVRKKTVQFRGEHSFVFTRGGLAEGQYLVRVWVDGIPEIRKLIVMSGQ